MAAVLSERGLNVVVLEAGGYFDDADFDQLEISAYQNLYWRGGPTSTTEMNVSVLAGSCLGGGTVVNWANSLRTTPWVREQWQRTYGLEGLADADFDRHLDAVLQRLSVTDRCSQLNGPQQRMKAGADKLGWSFKTVQSNIDERRYSFETAGYTGFGDQTGAQTVSREDLPPRRVRPRSDAGYALLGAAHRRAAPPCEGCRGDLV